jgi:hypothetical protein
MNAEEALHIGKKMRWAQRAYFANRTKENLIASKKAEKEFDAAVEAVLEGPGELFEVPAEHSDVPHCLVSELPAKPVFAQTAKGYVVTDCFRTPLDALPIGGGNRRALCRWSGRDWRVARFLA